MRKRMKFGQSSKTKDMRVSRNPTQPRMYQAEWEILKHDKKLTLTAPVEYHHRIIRMLRKEKHTDEVFSFSEAETHGVSRLVARSYGTRIEFVLVMF